MALFRRDLRLHRESDPLAAQFKDALLWPGALRIDKAGSSVVESCSYPGPTEHYKNRADQTMWKLGLLFGMLCAFCVTGFAAEKRVALVFGNASYKAPARPLDNPKADARLIAKSLQKVGFKVMLKEDASKSAMESAIQDFGAQADGADIALVYYAGHGMEIGGKNYLLPVDAKLANARELDTQTMQLDVILNFVEGAKLAIVVLDACRDNPFRDQVTRSLGTRSLSVGRGLAPVVPEHNMLIAYAAAAGFTAEDGTGRANSPYAEALARHLTDPGVDIPRMFGRVHDAVQAQTSKRQHPMQYGMLSGDAVYLVPPKDGSKPVVQASTQPQVKSHAHESATRDSGGSAELDYWRSADKIGTENAYRNYLKRYPKGEFAELATENVERLRATSSASSRPAPTPAPTHPPHEASGSGTPSPPGNSASSGSTSSTRGGSASEGIAALAGIAAALAASKKKGHEREHAPAVASVAGVWEGNYACAQGVAPMRLTINQGSDGSLQAQFDFNAGPGQVGAFRLSGRIDANFLRLNAYQWVAPAPGYSMVNLEGSVTPDLRQINGRILAPQCGGLTINRVR